MNIYLVSQNINNGYDTYDSIVVVAATEDEARLITPSGKPWSDYNDYRGDWVRTEDVYRIKVVLLGTAEPHLLPGTVLLASFNAG
jgi:hypothetical protein